MSSDIGAFWRSKSLAQMSDLEWESLCDGCGLCCCHKTVEEATQTVAYSIAVCRYLNPENRCEIYSQRLSKVPQCVALKPDQAHFNHLPKTCAYRCVAEARDIPNWHPLKTGQTVQNHPDAVSVRDWPVVSEQWVDLEEAMEHIIFKVS